MSSVKENEVALPIGVIVEKRKSKSVWSPWTWRPVAVFVDVQAKNPNSIQLIENDEFSQFYAGTLDLVLHRKDTEALRLNLTLSEPELYVVLREDESGESSFPYYPYMVTASSYDAQDFTDAGEDIVEKVAMPEAVAAFVQAFVEEHHVHEEFKKRRRDRLKTEDQRFGKTPIFQSHVKH